MNRRLVRVLAAAVGAAVAALYIFVGLGRVEVNGDIDSLLPADDPSVQALDGMARSFGGDPVVVLIEGGGDPLGRERLPALLQLEGRLAGLDNVVATYGPATTLNQTVVRIKEFVATLSGQRDALAAAGRDRALRRFEQRYAALLVQAMPAGLPTLRNEGFVRSVVYDAATAKVRPHWRQYLPREEAVAVYLRPREGLSQEAAGRLSRDVNRLVDESVAADGDTRVTVSGAPVVTTSVAEVMRAEVPRLAGMSFAVVALILLAFPWAGRRRLQLVPLAVMAVATAATIATFGWLGNPLSVGAATFLPIILGLGSYYPVYLAHAAHRRTVLAAAFASMCAFAGLLVSPLPFVSDLGFAVPLGLALVVALSMGVNWLTGGLASSTVLPPPPARTRSNGRPRVAMLAVVGVVCSLGAVGWATLGSVSLKTDPRQLLHGLPALDEAQHVEDVLGYSAEVDIRLIGEDVLTPEALAWSRQAEETVVTRYGDRLRPVVSMGRLLGFLGPRPTTDQIRAGLDALPEYVASAVVSSDGREALASYGAGWQELAGDRNLLAEVERALPEAPPGYSAEVSGLPVATGRGYDLVSESRYESNVLALLAALIALGCVLRRRSDAVLAVVAASAASGLAVLAVSVTGMALNPLTLALGVLTAAIGCEFTVLLAAARRQGDPRLARSVTLAAMMSLGGYGVLATSSLPVVRELGLALACSVALSALTAYLASRLVPTPDRSTTDDSRRTPGEQKPRIPAIAPARPQPLLTGALR